MLVGSVADPLGDGVALGLGDGVGDGLALLLIDGAANLQQDIRHRLGKVGYWNYGLDNLENYQHVYLEIGVSLIYPIHPSLYGHIDSIIDYQVPLVSN